MRMKTLLIIAVLGLIGLAALQAYVRLVPIDPEQANRQPVMPEPGPGLWVISSGAQAAVPVASDPAAALARFDGVIRAEPRSRVLAGRLEDGQLTYVIRTAFWGFPDLVTLAARPDGDGTMILIRSRQVIGRNDWGVNAARVTRWIAALDLPLPPDRSASP